jgi:poly-gamma-glutamate synthesis protein (capsule biosynthesis protein)
MLEIALVGDLVLDEPDADHWLSGIAPALHRADLAIGHLEVPHSDSPYELEGDIPAPGAPTENLAALARAGIGMVSLAGNHVSDCGPQGIADTIAGLEAAGILHAGAGTNLAGARRPAIFTAAGRRIAMLSYNCVGPEASWASEVLAGCAYLPLVTADGGAVTPRADLEDALNPVVLEILAADVAAARDQADLVIVSLHKGIVHTPARLAPYERPLAQVAIDTGADVVIAHHAHIVRGIEYHRGRPIFHGLGNGCVVTRALSPEQDHPARAEWARRRREMFGFEPDPEYDLAPFHPEAVNAFIGRLRIADDGAIEAGIIPVFVEPPGRPILADGDLARRISDYIEKITSSAGLPAIRVGDGGIVELAV